MGTALAQRVVRGSKGGESKQKQPKIASNGTASIATARIVYIWSWGPIVGPVNGLRSVKLDGTPLVADDGTENYPGVKWQFRNGELNQSRLDGIAESSNEIDVNQLLLTSAPWLRTINNPVLDAVRIRFSWPQLQAQDQKGNINGVRIDYAIDIATDGGPFVEMLTNYVDRKNVTKYERSHRIDLPAGSRWTIRARRLTPEANSSLVQDGMYVDAVAEVVDSDQEFPLTAVGCVEYDAEQFGGDIAKIAVLMRGRIVRVPANYDPETRTYATGGTGTSNGVWDGTFKEAYTNNPAWVVYDLVLNPYYGLGERVDATMIDRWNLYRIGQYCDQSVSDGQGGVQPRLTCNIYLQKQADAYAVLQDLAQIFHGMSTWDGSQITFNADMPGDPVYTYNPSQILNDGHIQYSGTRARDRHNLAMVTWDNPAQGFDTDKEPVFDDEAMAEMGRVSELSIDAYGCTSLAQAQRAGQYALLTEQAQTRGGTFRVGLDGQIPKPGQIIALADPMLSGRANGGRISAAAGRVVTLDRDIELPAGGALRVNLPSGKSEARVIRSVAGRQVTLAAEFTEVPEHESGWILEFDDLKTMQFLVRNITRPEWHQYQLECIQHEPSKFDVIDSGAVIDDRPISGIPIGVQDAPAGVYLSQHVVIEQGIAVTVMTISWDAAPGAVAYDVEWRWGAREWMRVPRTAELSTDVRGIYAGQYMARVRAVSALNVSSLPVTSLVTNLEGKVGLPPAVTSLIASTMLFGIALKWTFPPGADDTQRTEIWYGPTTDLGAATKLSDLAYPQSEYVMQGLKAGVTFFFWARLVDRTGNIGPWYPAGIGVMGQSSSDAAPILELIAGQIGETELGQDLVDKIDGLQDQIDGLSNPIMYKPEDAYLRGDVVYQGDRLYQAKLDVPAAADGSNAPPNATYWKDIGEILQEAGAVAGQVTQNTLDIEAQEKALTAQATKLDGVYVQVNPALAGDTAGFAGSTQVYVGAWSEQSARLEDGIATAKRLDTVQAEINSASAAVQTTSKAVADLDGKASAMWSVKLQVTSQGQYVAAGAGLGIENGPAGLQSQFLVSADRFAVVSSMAGGAISVPFAVQNGQVFINSAFIQDGTITNAKIGNHIQSNNYVQGQQGWKLWFDGTFEINSPLGGGGRQIINGYGGKVFDANGVKRYQWGNLDV